MPETPDGSQLLVLLYDELRALARARLGRVAPRNTLQPTALVHEAYLRLTKNGNPTWNSKGHFFGAAAEAMRQILVEQARRRSRLKHGGGRGRIELDDDLPIHAPTRDVLVTDEVIRSLETDDPLLASIVKLRFFAGLDPDETAAALEISRRTVERRWRYAAAMLRLNIDGIVEPEHRTADSSAALGKSSNSEAGDAA